MKKSKILLFLLLFLFIPKVNAGVLPNWYDSATKFTKSYIYDCYSSGCNAVTVSTQQATDGYWIINNYNNLLDIGTNGIGVQGYVGMMSPDYMYKYNLYLCSTKNIVSNTTKKLYTNGASDYGFDGTLAKYYNISYTALSTSIVSTELETTTCNYAYVITSLFVPATNNHRISINFSSSSTISDVGLVVVGYDFESLGNYGGLSTSDIEEVIANSNLATATSIEEVQTSVEEVKTELQELNNEQAETNDLLSNDNVDESTSEAESFFSGFETDTFGLTSVITAPLNLIASITSSSCSPLGLEIPFVNKTMNLPCLSSIYEEFFGSFLDIYQTITFGIVAYWVCVKIFNLVKDFKNPNHDEIEVLDL